MSRSSLVLRAMVFLPAFELVANGTRLPFRTVGTPSETLLLFGTEEEGAVLVSLLVNARPDDPDGGSAEILVAGREGMLLALFAGPLRADEDVVGAAYLGTPFVTRLLTGSPLVEVVESCASSSARSSRRLMLDEPAAAKLLRRLPMLCRGADIRLSRLCRLAREVCPEADMMEVSMSMVVSLTLPCDSFETAEVSSGDRWSSIEGQVAARCGEVGIG